MCLTFKTRAFRSRSLAEEDEPFSPRFPHPLLHVLAPPEIQVPFHFGLRNEVMSRNTLPSADSSDKGPCGSCHAYETLYPHAYSSIRLAHGSNAGVTEVPRRGKQPDSLKP